MKTVYMAKSLREETLAVIRRADEIIEDFQSQGYRMTLRQLYYQFVSRNLIANEEKSYKKLASIVSDGRLTMFGVGPPDMFEVQKVALTTAQVKQYQPPPNPAKLTDPRAENYIKLHGHHSWEVDSLDPPVLVKLITQALASVIDKAALARVVAEEKSDRERLRIELAKISF